ncbi:MAG: rhomboid family intramembrane serine protease, partial [Mesorhizobium sp.]|uniref:rhomboid family intramembrane serine protease n=1 Tax=Mesorhizobium sp. TaxID=1871066 RepID=UPI000FE4FF7A
IQMARKVTTPRERNTAAIGLVAFAPGIDSQIAWEAHIGGFVAGFFGLRAFDRRQQPDEFTA